MKKGIALPFLLILASATLVLGAFFLLDNKQKITNQKLTQTTSALPSVDTSNWKTYKNVNYGFSFNYPLSLSFSPSKNEVILENGNDLNSKKIKDEEYTYISINFEKDESSLALEDYLEKKNPRTINNIHSFKSLKDVSPILIDKRLGLVSLKGVSGHSKTVWIKNGTTFYEIFVTGNNLSSYTKKGEETFNNILSTFKFGDIKNVEWKTYKYMNSTFQYPETWEVDNITDLEDNDKNISIALLLTNTNFSRGERSIGFKVINNSIDNISKNFKDKSYSIEEGDSGPTTVKTTVTKFNEKLNNTQIEKIYTESIFSYKKPLTETSLDVLIPIGNKTIIFTSDQDNFTLLHQILTTFKFVE